MKAKTKEIKFTERDTKILEMLSYGWTNSEIAEHCKLCDSSVNQIVMKMMFKTNTVNRTHLVRWGFKNEYLK